MLVRRRFIPLNAVLLEVLQQLIEALPPGTASLGQILGLSGGRAKFNLVG